MFAEENGLRRSRQVLSNEYTKVEVGADAKLTQPRTRRPKFVRLGGQEEIGELD